MLFNVDPPRWKDSAPDLLRCLGSDFYTHWDPWFNYIITTIKIYTLKCDVAIKPSIKGVLVIVFFDVIVAVGTKMGDWLAVGNQNHRRGKIDDVFQRRLAQVGPIQIEICNVVLHRIILHVFNDVGGAGWKVGD